MTEKYSIDYLIKQIDAAAENFTSYKAIAEKSGIRFETIWRIRKRKYKSHNMQTANKILNAIEELRAEHENKKITA